MVTLIVCDRTDKESFINEIENVQYNAVLAITGATDLPNFLDNSGISQFLSKSPSLPDFFSNLYISFKKTVFCIFWKITIKAQ